jgi:hypothetical protein
MLWTGHNSNRPGRNSRAPLSFAAIHGSEYPTFCNHSRPLRRTMHILLCSLVPHNAEHMVDHRCNLLNAHWAQYRANAASGQTKKPENINRIKTTNGNEWGKYQWRLYHIHHVVPRHNFAYFRNGATTCTQSYYLEVRVIMDLNANAF